jgi:hypothetical protein
MNLASCLGLGDMRHAEVIVRGDLGNLPCGLRGEQWGYSIQPIWFFFTLFSCNTVIGRGEAKNSEEGMSSPFFTRQTIPFEVVRSSMESGSLQL